ncbi:MAG TPA: hypothetical protein DDZ51_07220 [Planctomycetaceae bacterium]|nr:hypothetical protein [Planctomycetaceae bacterium]
MTSPKEPRGGLAITDSLRQRIDSTLQLKDNVVLALTQAAESLTGLRRRELMRLSDRVAFVEHAELVLRDPVLLELFLPLIKAQPALSQNEERTRQGQVERQVFQALQRQTRQSHTKNERWGVVVYPLMVLLLSALVFATISIAVTPIFEQMFFEFGLTLPGPTLLVISISHIFQSLWFWLLFGVLVLAFAVILGMRLANNVLWLLSGSIDPWLYTTYSTRRSLGDLAWHTAMLVDIGIGAEASIEIAGAASRKATMRRESPGLARHFGLASPESRPPENPWVEQLGHGTTNWYLGVPCHLLSHALNIRQDDTQRSATLREIAKIYWDRDQTKSVWILSWLQPIAVLMISLIVGFVVLALFMPLVELISGLT